MRNIYDMYPRFYEISKRSTKRYIIISIDNKNNKVYWAFDNYYEKYKYLSYYETIIATRRTGIIIKHYNINNKEKRKWLIQ